MGVFLNEALVFHFSAAVDPSSVTAESLAIREEGSEQAVRGVFEVEADHIRFLPALGRERDLSDGGFVPGQRYEVVLRGFPAPDGLRAADGRVLARSYSFGFETVVLTEPKGQMFDDRSPLMAEPLVAEDRRARSDELIVQLGRGESIVMHCAEALDPSTLLDGQFVLRASEKLELSIALDQRLLENSSEAGARLELKPRRRLAPGRYFLTESLLDPTTRGPGVRDFGGNEAQLQGPVTVEVSDPSEGPGSADGRVEHIESFTSTDLSLPFVVPGVDGTATWLGDGRVTFRLPEAAGSGAEGPVELKGAMGAHDLHATSLRLARDDECGLLTAPGLVVLRAQKRMTIDGSLRRRSGEGEPITYQRGEPLSEWLARAHEANASWTVLIAGGDLVIDGLIDVDGPLLLAAGGRIRVSGEVRAQSHQIWVVGEGGGPSLRTASRAVLELDPPYENPLAEPMKLALVSGPMPPTGGVVRWIGKEVEALDRRGLARVRYMPEDFPMQAPLSEWGIVDDPSELLSTGALRLFIELEMGVADPSDVRDRVWDPPLVDEVRLFWEARPR